MQIHSAWLALGNFIQNIPAIVTVPEEIRGLDGPESLVNEAANVLESCRR